MAEQTFYRLSSQIFCKNWNCPRVPLMGPGGAIWLKNQDSKILWHNTRDELSSQTDIRYWQDKLQFVLQIQLFITKHISQHLGLSYHRCIKLAIKSLRCLLEQVLKVNIRHSRLTRLPGLGYGGEEAGWDVELLQNAGRKQTSVFTTLYIESTQLHIMSLIGWHWK